MKDLMKVILGLALWFTLMAFIFFPKETSALFESRERTFDLHFQIELKGQKTVEEQLFILKSANTGDRCVFHLKGVGGNANTMRTLINAIHATKCTTIMKVEDDVYSAWSEIAISGQYLIVAPGKMLMFHGVQFADEYGGPGTDRYTAEGKAMEKDLNGFLVWVMAPFFTDKELAYILEDHKREIHVEGPTMVCRFEAAKAGQPLSICGNLGITAWSYDSNSVS